MKNLIFLTLFVILGLFQSKAQCPCCSGSTSGFSGGESTPGVFTLGKNNWFGEMYFDYRSFNGISKGLIINEHNSSNVSALTVNNMGIGIIGLRYGISKSTSLLFQQPMFWINSPSANSKTFGDILSLINYVPFNKNQIVIGLQAGMEWPTGQVVDINNGSSISTGSGSFDPVVGLNVLRPYKNSFLRINNFFKYTTKGYNQTYFGNFYGHQINYTLLLNNTNTCSPDSLKKYKSKLNVSLNFQVSGEWSQMQLRDNKYIENTGSYIALAGFGSTFAYKGFTIPIMVNLPFYQVFHGEQNQTNFRLKIGITKTFK